jgi:uracil-DNA glycosylase
MNQEEINKKNDVVLNDYMEVLSRSGCVKCSARRPDRSCIPKGLYTSYTNDKRPIVCVLSTPRPCDEDANLILSSSEITTFKKWVEVSENMHGVAPLYVTTAVKCCMDKGDDAGKKPNKKVITTCTNNYLLHEIKFLNPKVVIVCGSTALLALKPSVKSTEVASHNKKIFKDHKLFLDKEEMWSGTLISTNHPAFVERSMVESVDNECAKLFVEAYKINNSTE